MKLTSRERIMRIFENKEIDRPALKLWGAGLADGAHYLHPAYEPVGKLAAEISDLFLGTSFAFNIYAGQNITRYQEKRIEDTAEPTWKNVHLIFHTPKGDLHQLDRVSTIGDPGYTLEHMVKEPEDLEKLLSMEYEPYPISRKDYDTLLVRVGDRGIVMPSIDHAAYALERLTGSENLAYFSIDCREELHAVIEVYAKRLREHVERIFDLGITAPIAWVGPELYIPPLMTPTDFQDFVFKYDKSLCDMIHERGGHVWVHCHGKVANFVESFINMGVDVLNPLEPPKNGDIHMGEIISRFGNRIGWEGNIEIQDLILASPERVKELIDECVRLGSASSRFILCPSAGFNEYTQPSPEYINNLLLYLTYGLETVEKYHY